MIANGCDLHVAITNLHWQIIQKDGKGLINLFELKADIEDQYQKDTNKDNTYYYTVFVDEYFYENNPLETSSNNNWGKRKLGKNLLIKTTAMHY